MTDAGSPGELTQRKEERDQAIRGVENLRALLDRVESRRGSATEPEERWAARAKALEEALAEGRLRVSRLDRVIRELEQETGSGQLPAPVPRVPTPLPASGEKSVVQARLEAAQKILGVAVFNLKDLPLEVFALAKAIVQSDDTSALTRGQINELNRRIAIYDRRRERERLDRERPTKSTEDRRHQVLLRQVLDKAQRAELNHLTLGEIDLLIHAHDLILQGHGAASEKDRLQEVLNRAIDEVCERWIRLRDIRDAF